MSENVVARRYAEALADVAIAHNQTEKMGEEVGAFAEMMKTNRELYEVFRSPIISQDDKGRVLNAIIAQTRPGPMTANLMRLLLSHHRLHNLEAVYEQFRREINQRKGIVLAEVTTAEALAAPDKEALTRRIQEMTGKQVELQFKTDASLIGGTITRIGSVVYDGSIRTQLKGIKQRLKEGTGGV